MRRGEILGLRWRDVDFVKGFILIADSKSGKARKIPMNGPVFDMLHEMSREREFVFENPKTRTCYMDFKTAFKGGCSRTEIKGIRFHDTRHTAISRVVETGADLVTVSRILGHASIQMTMRYAHPTPENMQRVVDRLADALDPSRQKPSTISIPKTVKDTIHYN